MHIMQRLTLLLLISNLQKNERRNLDKAIAKTKDRLANTNKGKSNNYNMSIDNFAKKDGAFDKEKFHNTFQKAMSDKKGKLVFN